MDYRAHYARLIERARDRRLRTYCERHHVIPKCLGGGDDIVRLTPEEHYVAHLLLVKIHPRNHRLLWAAMAMTNATKVQRRSNKLYGWLRRQMSEVMSERAKGRTYSPEVRAKMGRRKGSRFPHAEETKAKISAGNKGKQKSEAHRAALARAKLGTKRGPHSEEVRKKISESNRRAALLRDQSVYRTPEYRSSQAQKTRDMWASRKAESQPA